MAIDPVAAALDAVVAYLTGLGITGLTARRGWPEANVELDIDQTKHVVAVLPAGKPTVRLVSPKSIDQTGSGTLTVTYRVGEIEVPAQLDLWCAYRAQRDEVVAAIEARLHNKLPFLPGLWLTSTGYHSRPLVVDVVFAGTDDEQDDAAVGEWRATWDVTIRSDLVADATHPELAIVALRLETELDSITITEADHDVES